jgi:hypothetical protein
MKVYIFLIVFFNFLSCKYEVKNRENKIGHERVDTHLNTWEKLPFEEQIRIIKAATSKDSILSNDIQFINDSILKGKFQLDISRYELESKKNRCYPIRLAKKMVYEFYEQGFKNLGDLNGDKKDEKVFVLHALNYCENGDSYYFTNNKIPRIQTESNCCHPESIFSIGDIDEDGGNEIAEYYSSCSSNLKCINIWTLKENNWKFVEKFAFYYHNGKYEAFKDFKKMYKKIGKNKFKFLEISDMRGNGVPIQEWKIVTMK